MEINDNTTRKVVVIMGGDGSFATTIKFLRTSKEVERGLSKGKLCFAVLPFGTGNDGAQAFGWGASPCNEAWFNDVEALMRDLITASCVSLSLWNVHVNGKVLSASGEKIDNKHLMCYYFNLGLDARVGLEVERNRKRTRCCNYIYYALCGIKNYLTRDYSDARLQVNKIVSLRKLQNGVTATKLVTDMDQLIDKPLNVCGYNLNSGYGNLV